MITRFEYAVWDGPYDGDWGLVVEYEGDSKLQFRGLNWIGDGLSNVWCEWEVGVDDLGGYVSDWLKVSLELVELIYARWDVLESDLLTEHL